MSLVLTRANVKASPRHNSVTCFLDESDTKPGEDAPICVIGAIVLNTSGLACFNRAWSAMLDYHGLPGGVHMRTLPPFKRKVLADAVEIIRAYRIYTLSVSFRHDDYMQVLSEASRYQHSPYEFGYIIARLWVGGHADLNGYHDPIAFHMDEGNTDWPHVVAANHDMRPLAASDNLPSNLGDLEPGNDGLVLPSNLGDLEPGNDGLVLPLQAADAVTWSSRRKFVGHPFDRDLRPLGELLNDK